MIIHFQVPLKTFTMFEESKEIKRQNQIILTIGEQTRKTDKDFIN